LSFMVSKEGKTMEPIEMNMVGIAKEPIPNTDYDQEAYEYDVEMSDSLKEVVKRAVLDMPTWEKPAVSESGTKDALVDVGIRFLKIEVDSTALNPEKMPEFPGGTAELMKWLVQNIKYPTICQKNGIQGRVIVQFVVDKDGVICDPYVIKGVDPYLDKEALRLVRKMPVWKPGIQKGKPVRVKYTLPITFRLK
ncbi:MAG: energy transducer TonB, partial [Bacteroidaceae bacterium]|nr:energy transducer TonB [Bacteroidaceae bacterium]